MKLKTNILIYILSISLVVARVHSISRKATSFFLQNSWLKEDLHLPAGTSMKVAPEMALQMVLVVHLRKLQTVKGEDITDTASFINSFSGKDSNVALFEVSRKEVEKNSTSFSKLNLKPIPGTLKMHQMFTTPFRNRISIYQLLL